MANVSASNDRGGPGSYLRLALLNFRSPPHGHKRCTGSGAQDPPLSSSCGISVMANTLSSKVMEALLSKMPCTKKLKLMVKLTLYMMSTAVMTGSRSSTLLNNATDTIKKRMEQFPSNWVRKASYKCAAMKSIIVS